MIIILDNLRSAYNVGSIIRTCDALGIKKIHFCGITPDDRNPKVTKTSLGAEKNIRPSYGLETFGDIKNLKAKGYQVIGLELSNQSVNLSNLKRQPKSALVVGNEVSGLSPEIMDLCDYTVQIPMKGIKESLNVSVAFGIAAYELTKT